MAVVVPLSASTEPQAAPTQKLHRWRTVSGPSRTSSSSGCLYRHAAAEIRGCPLHRCGNFRARIGRPQTRGLVDERARGLPPDKSPELLKQASSGTRPPIFVPPPLLWAEGWGGGLSVILPYVGFDVGFAMLPALRAAIGQGRVAWRHLMVSPYGVIGCHQLGARFLY